VRPRVLHCAYVPFATVHTTMNLNVQFISFIDNREFLGLDGLSLDPLENQAFVLSELSNSIPSLMFLLNWWSANGLLVN